MAGDIVHRMPKRVEKSINGGSRARRMDADVDVDYES